MTILAYAKQAGATAARDDYYRGDHKSVADIRVTATALLNAFDPSFPRWGRAARRDLFRVFRESYRNNRITT